MKFEDLKLNKELVDSLKAIGLEKPTEVQEKAIPMIFTGKDLIVRKQDRKWENIRIPLTNRTKSFCREKTPSIDSYSNKRISSTNQ